MSRPRRQNEPRPKTWVSKWQPEGATPLGGELKEFSIQGTPGGDPNIETSSIMMLVCDQCILFRSKRNADACRPRARPCGCSPQSGKIAYKLDVGDLYFPRHGETSDFVKYREALKQELESNVESFRRQAMYALRHPTGDSGPLRHDEFYIRILIDIVPHSVEVDGLHKGVNVTVTTPPLDPEARGELGSDPRMIPSFKGWRTELESRWESSYTGIGIALDFNVHYLLNKVHFGVQMGVPLTRKSVNSERLKPRLTWWQQKISSGLGDRLIPDPDDMQTLEYLGSLDPDTISKIDISDLPPEQIQRLHEYLIVLRIVGPSVINNLRRTTNSDRSSEDEE